MLLGPAARLGPYEIVSAIGAGGMGEVYRARDIRLGRNVAVKVLPAAFAADSERLERFKQEARAAAALNHPNILAVHDIGVHDGTPFIVSELLEGETLGERLQDGTLPVRKAIEYAVQIAHGLAAAHEKGIAHRDLKPENIFVVGGDRVKILDFGLAKLMQPEPAPAGLTTFPTVSAEFAGVPGTLPGVVLGTVGYMSPEQVRGAASDYRSDIFAFGTVLYEMLSGRPAFRSESPIDSMTAILRDDPPALPVAGRQIPPALARIVSRCLEKTPAARFKSTDDLAFALEALSIDTGSSVTGEASGLSRRRTLAWRLSAFAAIVTSVAAAFAGGRYFQGAPVQPPEMRLQIVTPPNGGGLADFAISPDGRHVVFRATIDGRAQLWLRALASENEKPLVVADVGNRTFPFWSPDSQTIGFFADQKLKRVDIAGGTAQIVTDSPDSFGAAWSADDTIIFATANISPLLRVPASGGQARPATRVDAPKQLGHRFPSFLPDGRHFLLFVTGLPEIQGVHIGSLDSMETRHLVASDTKGVFVPPDRVLFVRRGTLLSQRINLEGLEPIGNPEPLQEGLAQDYGRFATVALSASLAGPIAYRPVTSERHQLMWVDRAGKPVGMVGEPHTASLGDVELSPDGGTAAVTRTTDGNRDAWLVDISRGVTRRLTSNPGDDGLPYWSPDGRRFAYASQRRGGGLYDLYQGSLASGSGDELLLASAENKNLFDWSADGRFILFTSQNPDTARDIWALPLAGDRRPFVLLETRFEESGARFTPDGRWISYTSNESGRNEIYLQPFPEPTRSIRISTNGGVGAQWRGDGLELFYVAPGNRLMSVAVMPRTDASMDFGTPKELFTMRPGTGYAVWADGQRFLINTPLDDEITPPITVLLNWAHLR